MLVPSCFECTLRLGKGAAAFVLLRAVNKQLRLNPPSGFFLEGAWLLLTEPMFEFSRWARKQVWSLTHKQVDKALNAKLVKSHSKNPCLNAHRVHDRKLVSVEGGDCSKRSNFV